jgi:mRNA interferase RelE/StbE
VEVTILEDAERDIAALSGVMQLRVLDVIARLEKWPHVSGVKKLTGDWAGFSRVRIGDYRVVFQVLADRIRIVRVAHRREVYD